MPLLKLAWPLGGVAMLAALTATIPCIVIERRLGEAALGVYAALAYFHAASNRIVSEGEHDRCDEEVGALHDDLVSSS